MTRFAWIQARTQSAVAVALVGMLAIAAAVTGIHLSHLYNSLVASCDANNSCAAASATFLSHDTFLQDSLTLLMRIAPAILGVFWGAPLLTREFEAGTFRLVWTQSVTRSRWLITKLGLVGLATVLVTGALTLTVTWWYRAVDHVNANQYGVFDARDVAPIGYALFAFAAGALFGAIIRRTLPAMAATLGVFAFARIAMNEWIRPTLLTPLHRTVSLLDTADFGFISQKGAPLSLVAKGPAGPNEWVQSTHIIDSSEHAATAAERSAFITQHCPGLAHLPPTPPDVKRAAVDGQTIRAFHDCRVAASQTFHLSVTYQPGSRYWTFQWLELAIFVALALICLGACYWWVTRRLT
jgi:ABC-type transport system involved in multi-copper enzyme maturation permease subunit